jgi:hypothetical protein
MLIAQDRLHCMRQAVALECVRKPSVGLSLGLACLQTLTGPVVGTSANAFVAE